jgi:hypothetical protein
MAMRVPKIAPAVLERHRVCAWLDSHAQTAVRLVWAPAGAGKTTGAVLYARRCSGNVSFVAVVPGTTETELVAQIASCAGCTAQNYAELVDQLAGLAPLEIFVDNVDGATADGRALLGRIYLDVPDGVTFVYLARSEDAVPLRAARAKGLVDVCDPALLAFDTDEIAQLAELLGVEEGLPAAARLREATHGWAIAVAGACRTAAANGLPLADALPAWRRMNDRALRELVSDACEGVGPEVATAFDELAAGRSVGNAEGFAACRRAGLFVSEWNGRLAINPLFRSVAGALPTNDTGVSVSPAVIEMFGRFEMSIDGHPIAWIRRRDRQIVAFLATRRSGRATRAEIIAAFWPDADRQLAGQSLRTACSTIRRAIAACVGRANVRRYFIGDYVLELVLENAVVSSREFSTQYELAMAAYEGNEFAAAFAHLRAAELLYRSPFLAGEPPAPWALSYEEKFASMHGDVSALLDKLSRARWKNEAPPAALRANAIHQVSA